jgi:hypothetical protein
MDSSVPRASGAESDNRNNAFLDPNRWARSRPIGATFDDGRPPGPQIAGESVASLEQVAAALESAATPQDQLQVSCGLPLVMDAVTGRYSLAPSAAAVLRFTNENANREPPQLNMGPSRVVTAAIATARPVAGRFQRSISTASTDPLVISNGCASIVYPRQQGAAAATMHVVPTPQAGRIQPIQLPPPYGPAATLFVRQRTAAIKDAAAAALKADPGNETLVAAFETACANAEAAVRADENLRKAN